MYQVWASGSGDVVPPNPVLVPPGMDDDVDIDMGDGSGGDESGPMDVEALVHIAFWWSRKLSFCVVFQQRVQVRWFGSKVVALELPFIKVFLGKKFVKFL